MPVDNQAAMNRRRFRIAVRISGGLGGLVGFIKIWIFYHEPWAAIGCGFGGLALALFSVVYSRIIRDRMLNGYSIESIYSCSQYLETKEIQDVLIKHLARRISKQEENLDDNERRIIYNLIDQNPAFIKLLAKSKNINVRKLAESYSKGEKGNLIKSDLIAYPMRKIAANYKSAEIVFEALAKDKASGLRKLLAQDQSTPPNALEILAKDRDYHVRLAVAYNPNTPPNALEMLAKDKYSFVRRAVAYNPNTPPNALEMLAKDKRKTVSILAKMNKNAPENIKVSLVHHHKVFNDSKE